ncbi:hypothetical protein [Pseudoalteromonas tunicata]|nr:hypothetical protein [Pseudoalteromonas tunicata]ATC95565.1 hypothetical protein PTUN_a3187 [Pseudoalteromonas tunicata]AXT31137.1 hypothetical protein D1819_10200 [Pseudoalteromonas tunicata]
MKKLLTTTTLLATALLTTPVLVNAATDAILKVRTVDQVGATEQKSINLGQIAASPGYECMVPQRIDISTQAGTNTDFQIDTISYGTLPAGVNACGSSTAGYFSLKGVPNQNVRITFAKDPSSTVGSFQPEGVYKAAAYADVADPLDLAAVQAGVTVDDVPVQTVYDEVAKTLIQIFDAEDVKLSASGDGMIAIGGTLKINESLMPDTTYTVNYIVNVTYL